MVPDGVLQARKLPDWPTGPRPRYASRPSLRTPTTSPGRPRTDLLAAVDGPMHQSGARASVQLTADAPLDARYCCARLVVADPTAYGYLVDLTSAGDDTGAAAGRRS